jgi:serine/threonine-protein kinase HipA
MEKCLYCYETLLEGQADFHPRCAAKIFETKTVPVLPYARADISVLAEEIIRSQTTLTGAQPKLSLDIAPNSGQPKRFTIVGLWGKYILKPQTDKYTSLPELEDVTMHLAEIAKIKTVPHSLSKFSDGELCYITRRIDRGPKGEKYLMEDMCQLSERLTEYKYKGSYEQIAKLILAHSATPKLDVINFWEQVLFSWLTGNADMHLKNFSLISFAKGQYSLTPAYDLLSTTLVMPDDKEELALTLNGKKRKINRTDFETSMLASGLEPKIATNILSKFQKFSDKWYHCIDVSFLPLSMKEQYKALLKVNLEKIR